MKKILLLVGVGLTALLTVTTCSKKDDEGCANLKQQIDRLCVDRDAYEKILKGKFEDYKRANVAWRIEFEEWINNPQHGYRENLSMQDILNILKEKPGPNMSPEAEEYEKVLSELSKLYSSYTWECR